VTTADGDLVTTPALLSTAGRAAQVPGTCAARRSRRPSMASRTISTTSAILSVMPIASYWPRIRVYAFTPRAFGELEQAVAQRFADETSGALGLALRLAAQTKMSQNQLNALASRGVIGQALGVIMAENRCTADEALEMLRMISQNRNIKLHDIAGQIIAAVSGHPASSPQFT
jgi:ANTAR domain-containing protein